MAAASGLSCLGPSSTLTALPVVVRCFRRYLLSSTPVWNSCASSTKACAAAGQRIRALSKIGQVNVVYWKRLRDMELIDLGLGAAGLTDQDTVVQRPGRRETDGAKLRCTLNAIQLINIG